jgi:phosphoribosyl 1,2-cyclic phosphodiesterase
LRASVVTGYICEVTSDRFEVRYWGVRGSIPVPGHTTLRYGGNTTCLSIHCGEEVIIIDCGSGARALGKTMMEKGSPSRATILFSHLHWDHIQGFPFFQPAFTAGCHLDVWADHSIEGDLLEVLQGQMAQPTFPVSLEEMDGGLVVNELSRERRFAIGDDIQISAAPLNHPGGASAWRIDYRGRSFVHASDHEHEAVPHKPLVDLAQGADYLSYDSTYTTAEYLGEVGISHVGWGHSTWEEAIKVARASSVKNLILTHHDPERTDDQLDEIGEVARARFANTLVAHEGMVLDLLA